MSSDVHYRHLNCPCLLKALYFHVTHGKDCTAPVKESVPLNVFGKYTAAELMVNTFFSWRVLLNWYSTTKKDSMFFQIRSFWAQCDARNQKVVERVLNPLFLRLRFMPWIWTGKSKLLFPTIHCFHYVVLPIMFILFFNVIIKGQ